MHKPSLIRAREWVKFRSKAVSFRPRFNAGVIKNSLAVVGFASVITVSAMQANPQLASGLFETFFPVASALVDAEAESVSADTLATEANRTQTTTASEKRMTEYLSARFRVSHDAMADMVRYALVASEKHRLDPALVLAVAAVESGFNPVAASPMGAKGLMQVMHGVHRDKFAAYSDIRNAPTHPQVNLLVGAEILRDCINRGGGVQAGLKLYLGVGAGDDNGYVAKVVAEAARIRAAANSRTLDAQAPRIKSSSKSMPRASVSKSSA